MKKYLLLILFTYSTISFAQFSEDLVLQLHAGTLADMNTMSGVAQKTKVFYNTTDNKLYYHNGTSWLVIDGKDGSKDAWIDNSGNTRIELETKADGTTARDADTEFVINDEGNVGIGTDTPSLAKLHIEGEGVYEGIMRLINTGTNGADFFMGATRDSWSVGSNKFVMGHGVPSDANVDMVIASNGNVGIGVDSPASSLEVGGTGLTLAGVTRTTWPSGSGTGAFTDTGTKAYYNGGNVGIGTSNPLSTLHVEGMITTKASQYSGNFAIHLKNSDIGGVNEIFFNDLGEGINWTSSGSSSANTKVKIYASDTAPTSHFIIRTELHGNLGNVGINTTTPDEKFEIEFGSTNKDVEIGIGTTDPDVTFITLRNPNGTKYYVTVANDGTISTSTTKP